MSLLTRAIRQAEPRADSMRGEAQHADAVMRTLGYETSPTTRSVPGPLTKAAVVLICALAVGAGFWLGSPPERVSVPGAASAGAADGVSASTPGGTDRVDPPASVDASSIERTGQLGDIELPSEGPAVADSAVDVDSGPARDESLEGPGRGDSTSLVLADDRPDREMGPLMAPLPTTKPAGPFAPVVALSDDELRALVELDIGAIRRRASQTRPRTSPGDGSAGDAVDPDRAGARATPVRVARSSRPVATPTAPPEPPPPATLGAASASPGGSGFRIALRHHESGDFDAARRDYLDLIAADDADAEARNNLGVLYEEQGRTDEAIREFERALAIDPTYVKAHNNLGVAFLAVGRLEEAGREFERALSRDPGNLESKVNLGLVLHATGQWTAAIERLLEVIDVDPGHMEAHYNLALVYEAHGDADRALAEYRQFLALGTARHPELVDGVRRRVELLASSRLLP